MKIGFTGARGGMTLMQKAEVQSLLSREFEYNKTNEAHHGGCKGADEEFDDICFKLNQDTPLEVGRVVHPSDLSGWRGKWHLPATEMHEYPPLERNHHIVDAVELMVAAPVGMVGCSLCSQAFNFYHEALRSGTWSCIRYAKKIGRELFIVYPDGSLVGF